MGCHNHSSMRSIPRCIYVQFPDCATSETQPVVPHNLDICFRRRHLVTVFYLGQAIMDPRPYSPDADTGVFMASSIDDWTVFSRDNQSDSDATRQSPTPSGSFGHSPEDVLDDIIDSMLPVPSVPPQLSSAYERLSPFLGCSYVELLELVSCPSHDTRLALILPTPYLATYRMFPSCNP
jgi:hypothetical protein